MDKRLEEKLKITEWNVEAKVLYWYFFKKGHLLSPRWVGPVYITNKAGPTVYELELCDPKGK